MKWGTPLRPSAIRVLLLGSGELGKELVIALQRYGVEVMAADRYPDAPAMQVAHHASVLDMTDAAALRALMETYQPDFVVPEIEAIATEVLAALEAAGQAVIVPSARAVTLTLDREGIRRLAAETLALPASRYAFASSLEELHQAVATVGYPCFIKPVMSSSGKGQSQLVAAVDGAVEDAWRHACDGGRVPQTRVIVESRVEFDFEITLLTVASRPFQGGAPQITCCAPIGHRQVAGDYVESWQPQQMSDAALQEAQRIAVSVVEALGGVGLFGVELFVRGDEVWFSEVSPRPHDTGMVTMVTQRQNEFELHARALLGLPLDTGLMLPGASAVIYGGFDGDDCCYPGLAEALAVPGTEVRLFGKPEVFTRRRMGVALAVAETVEQARQRASLAASRIHPEPA
ncbi:MAG: formate-dependent phosphoribosylglycinamide formyltransferase [Pseudomonadota bacterium]